MASTSLSIHMSGFYVEDLRIYGQDYQGTCLAVFPQLCSDVVLGQDFQGIHDNITLKYKGRLSSLVICGVNNLKVDSPELFANVTTNC